MTQARQDSRDRKIAELKAQVAELRAQLAESEKRRSVRETSLLEHGLRLSQENEFLRMEIAALKKSRK